jgi:putative spermidine/putrescine transport system ATP-binding protein
MPELALNGIHKRFGNEAAVLQTSLTFKDGELTALLGPSGCGKTTLIRMVAGLEAPTGGHVMLDGVSITEQPAHLRKFGMVFQSFALFPHLTVAENVAYSLKISGVDRRHREHKAQELLELVQLPDYGKRRIGELSGGQRQRVAIARALAQEPSVFLLDEPMSALDAKLREEMQVELRLLQQRLGITTIVVTHDQREAMTMADRIVVMKKGQVEQVGTPDEIYNNPTSLFVASFIGKANLLGGTVHSGAVTVGSQQIKLQDKPDFIEGAQVTLFSRPERSRIVDSIGENTIEAQVTYVRNVGASFEYHLNTVLGALMVEQPNRHGKSPISTGQTILVQLPANAIKAFPRLVA